jgi:hypothetical protein
LPAPGHQEHSQAKAQIRKIAIHWMAFDD